MPPVLEERQEIDEVLEENKDIAHFSESSYVFTDISTSVCNRVRLMITEVPFLGDSSFFVLCIKPIAILTFALPFLLNVVTNPNCLSWSHHLTKAWNIRKAPGVQEVYNIIHWKNLHPVDKY